MSMNKSYSFNFGFANMLAIAFITLKLCKVIDWSWWWVLSPLWIPFCIVAIIFSLVLAIQAIIR